jgi:hypothetical protein
METGYVEAVATLVGVADGTASLYFSNGGGFIGAATHANVAEANRRRLETGIESLPELSVVTDPPVCGDLLRQKKNSATADTGCHRSSMPDTT